MKEFLKTNRVAISVILTMLLTLAGVKMPIGTDIGDNQQLLQEGLTEILRPMIQEVVKEELECIKIEITELKNYNIEEITGRAVSAYSKVFTIEDLNDSPEKRFSITQGLKLDSCKTILMAIDRERTLMFYDYLIEK